MTVPFEGFDDETLAAARLGGVAGSVDAASHLETAALDAVATSLEPTLPAPPVRAVPPGGLWWVSMVLPGSLSSVQMTFRTNRSLRTARHLAPREPIPARRNRQELP